MENKKNTVENEEVVVKTPTGKAPSAPKKVVEEKRSAIDLILDTECDENVVLYGADGEGIEFEQIALIPYNEEVYVILKPIDEFEGVGEDEAVVFVIKEADNDEYFLDVEGDEEVVNAVFDAYYKLFDEQK